MYTFNKTVRGYLHIIRGSPCEDASRSYSASNGTFHIAAVADGHGSSSCFRSSKGAEFAITVTFNCLKQFAETLMLSKDFGERFYQNIFSDPRYRKFTFKQLTDTIVVNWYDSVINDYKNNPLSVSEMELVPEKYENNITHIYGTTILAALMLPSCLILLHQGDGRCDVFYEDGTIDQPIPWDSRCEGNITTSLCDSDATESFRSCVINLNRKKVMACYLGSDGVEDAYRDTYEDMGSTHCLMGGVHTFYKDLSCHIASSSQFDFEEYLDNMLPEFSRTGSGDDVSIAGIVNIEALRLLVRNFEIDVKEYSLEENLAIRENDLASKRRKHEFLKEARDKAQNEYERIGKPFIDLFERLEQLEAGHSELTTQINSLLEQLSQAKNIEREIPIFIATRSSQQLSQATQMYLTNLTKQMKETGLPIGNISDRIANDIKKIRLEASKLYIKRTSLDEELQKIRQSVSNAPESLKTLEKNFKDAEAEFLEYDAKYQAIEDEKELIQNELEELHILRKQNEEK